MHTSQVLFVLLVVAESLTALSVTKKLRAEDEKEMQLQQPRVTRSQDAHQAYYLATSFQPKIDAHQYFRDQQHHHQQQQHHHHQPSEQLAAAENSAFAAALLAQQNQEAAFAQQAFDISKIYTKPAKHYSHHHVKAKPALTYKSAEPVSIVYTSAKPTALSLPAAAAVPVPVSVPVPSAPVLAFATAAYTGGEDRAIEQAEAQHASKYKFGYRVSDPHTGAEYGHSEVSEGHVTKGQYHVLLPDGRLQHVKYWADPTGYHATVTYETPKIVH